jgi:hypothetical protein
MSKYVSVAAALFIVLGGACEAYAQQQKTPDPRQRPVARPAAQPGAYHTLQQHGFDVFTKAQEMPGIPLPGSNSKFISGQSKHAPDGSTSITQRFAITNDMSSVVPYYKAALGQSGWKISSESQFNLSATRKDLWCNVLALPSRFPGYHSDVILAARIKKAN